MKEYIQVKKKRKQEFSKRLLVQESLLIWFISVSFIILAFLCVINGYLGTLPWLAAMVSFPWAAYGVSQAFYYRKSQAENTKGGIVYETAQSTPQYEPNTDYGI